MEQNAESAHMNFAASVWDVARARFLDLGREEKGAALVITLAMFFLMYLACCGVFAVSTAVKERIHLQNAADAAVYSAAVVQADTLSRIATINRAMSWTYVDMTRRQMDYIVRRWLWHTVHHYKQDQNGADSYNKGGFHDPCGHHGSPGVGWFIGTNPRSMNSLFKVNLNGILSLGSYLGLDLQTDELVALFASFGQGVTVNIDTLENELQEYDALSTITQLEDVFGSDPFSSDSDVLTDMESVAKDVCSFANCLSNLNTADSIKRMWDDREPKKRCSYCEAEGAQTSRLKAKIFFDRFNIARMNIAERNLALEMPGRISHAVNEVLKSNLPDDLAADCLYMLDQNNYVLDGDGEDAFVTGNGYFVNLLNRKSDEERFLAFADFRGGITEVFNEKGDGIWNADPLNTTDRQACGVEQWFVRGNGEGRTDGAVGLQRCYRHWAEGVLSSIHAAHSPLPPTCWNVEEKYLDGNPATVALYSEWAWWSDVWCCPRIVFKRVHLHPMPHMSEFWPMKMECDHNSKPGLFGTEELKGAVKSLEDMNKILEGIEGVAKGALKGKDENGNDVDMSEDDYVKQYGDGEISEGGSVSSGGGASDPLGDVDLSGLTKEGDVKYGESYDEKKLSSFSAAGIESYEDGCLITYPVLNGTSHMVGYGRMYADAPQIYDSAYVGECAKPLVLTRQYFGPQGTLSVGIRRENRNVFERILGVIEGIFHAFDPDWNGLRRMTHTYVFASAKAGYKDKGESAESLDYKVDWQPDNQSWNLCQSDWDAVFVPVRKANAVAVGIDVRITDEIKVPGVWYSSYDDVLEEKVSDDLEEERAQTDVDDDVLEKWVSDDTKWMTLNGDNGDVDGWDSITAPKGVLRGDSHTGTLDWRALSHVMYH